MNEKNKKVEERTIKSKGYRSGAIKFNVTKKHNLDNLVGIVPISGYNISFGTVCPHCLTQVAPGFSMIENCVYRCANFGCKSIWILCNDGMEPIIRATLGDFIFYYGEKTPKTKNFFRRNPTSSIPIYYVPLRITDSTKKRRKNCVGWSILSGIATINKFLTSGISHWVTPDRYYVGFYPGIFSTDNIEGARLIHEENKDKAFYFAHNGNTVADNEMLDFIIRHHEVIDYYKLFREAELKSAKNDMINLDRIFKTDIITDSCQIEETDWYYKLDTWSSYRKFCGDERTNIKRPNFYKIGHRRYYRKKGWNSKLVM